MKKIHKSGKLLHSLVGNHDGIILLVDDKSNILVRRSSITQIKGLPEEGFKKISVNEYCHPEDRKKFESVITEALANPGNPIRATVRVKRKNGHYLRMEGVATNRLYDKNINGIVIDFHYVNKRKETEQKIIKTNRLYHFISQLNQMIVRAADEESLFKEACLIAVRQSEFPMAWIGIINKQTKILEPVVYAGMDPAFLSSLKIIVDKDNPEKNT